MEGTTTKSAAMAVPAFATVILIINGFFNLIHSWQMLDKADWYSDTAVLLSDKIETWGYLFLIFGALQLLFGIVLATSGGAAGWARMGGLVMCTIACVVWMFLLFSAPFAAFLGILINVWAISDLTKE